MFYAYILGSDKTGRYYIGSCEDVQDRLRRHNNGETASTRGGIRWRVVHVEEFCTRAEAMRKEKQIKARGAARYLASLSGRSG